GFGGEGPKRLWERMPVLKPLAIHEPATWECKKREADTPELRAALDLLEPHIQPAWLIPQFRHNLDGEQEHEYAAREGQQQVFRATFPGIRDSLRALIQGEWMPSLGSSTKHTIRLSAMKFTG